MRNMRYFQTMATLMAALSTVAVDGRQATPCQQQQGAVEDLEAQVAATEGVEQSAGVLIGELAKYIEAHKTDPAALQALADRLKASSDALATAVANNPDPDPND